MGTRPELSVRNGYWIEKHRFYELKQFCLQYPIWKKAYDSLDGLSKKPLTLIETFGKSSETNDPTARCAIAKQYYRERMEMLENAAHLADEDLADYILKGVTGDRSYSNLVSVYGLPCSKDMYYDRYHKFFWHLNKIRQ